MERIKPELTTSKMEETIMPLEKIVHNYQQQKHKQNQESQN